MRTTDSRALMQAAVIREHGGPDHLVVEAIERPEPGAGEALVRVAACALNHLDIFVRRGMPGLPVPLPHIGGGDIAGWVEALGANAAGIKIGAPVLVDPVIQGDGMLGETRRGGLAEYVTVPVTNLLPIPDESRMPEFASLPVAYGTARRMILTRAKLTAGETLVVVGASGGVGVGCVQLGKAARPRRRRDGRRARWAVWQAGMGADRKSRRGRGRRLLRQGHVAAVPAVRTQRREARVLWRHQRPRRGDRSPLPVGPRDRHSRLGWVVARRLGRARAVGRRRAFETGRSRRPSAVPCPRRGGRAGGASCFREGGRGP